MRQLFNLGTRSISEMEHQAWVFSRIATAQLLMLLAMSRRMPDPAICAMRGLNLLRKSSGQVRTGLIRNGLAILASDLNERPPLVRESNVLADLIPIELACGSSIFPLSTRIVLSILRCRPLSRTGLRHDDQGENNYES